MRVIGFILIILIFSNCNLAILKSRDKLLIKKKGLLILRQGYSPEFIPVNIDTSLNIEKNLILKEVGVGIYLDALSMSCQQYLYLFADTLEDNVVVIPVILEYIKVRETNKQLRQKEQIKDVHVLKIVGEEKYYFVRGGNYYVFQIRPYVSLRKEYSINID